MSTDDSDTLDFARVLADGTRQRIMRACCCQWCSVGALVEALGAELTQPTISHHLAVLRDAGLVQSRRQGRQVLYRLNQQRIAYCCGQLLVELAPETPAAAAVRDTEAC